MAAAFDHDVPSLGTLEAMKHNAQRRAEAEARIDLAQKSRNIVYARGFDDGYDAGQKAGIELGMQAGHNQGLEERDKLRDLLRRTEEHNTRLHGQLNCQYTEVRCAERERATADRQRDEAEARLYGFLFRDRRDTEHRLNVARVTLAFVAVTLIYHRALAEVLAEAWGRVQNPGSYAVLAALFAAIGCGVLLGRNWTTRPPKAPGRKYHRDFDGWPASWDDDETYSPEAGLEPEVNEVNGAPAREQGLVPLSGGDGSACRKGGA